MSQSRHRAAAPPMEREDSGTFRSVSGRSGPSRAGPRVVGSRGRGSRLSSSILGKAPSRSSRPSGCREAGGRTSERSTPPSRPQAGRGPAPPWPRAAPAGRRGRAAAAEGKGFAGWDLGGCSIRRTSRFPCESLLPAFKLFSLRPPLRGPETGAPRQL